jgi:hypothetical protein
LVAGGKLLIIYAFTGLNFRKMEERVQHLQGERWDYKGWYYEPVSSNWVDWSRYQAERYRDQYEGALIFRFKFNYSLSEHGHYSG